MRESGLYESTHACDVDFGSRDQRCPNREGSGKRERSDRLIDGDIYIREALRHMIAAKRNANDIFRRDEELRRDELYSSEEERRLIYM